MVLESFCRNGNRLEEIITGNGKEFINEGFKELCHQIDIRHRKVSIESQRSNGRVESVIGTLRETILKMKEMSFDKKVHKIIEIYNNSLHLEIGCTPTETIKDNTGKVLTENGPEVIIARNLLGVSENNFLEELSSEQLRTKI